MKKRQGASLKNAPSVKPRRLLSKRMQNKKFKNIYKLGRVV
jgi:hypothetical protein